MSKKRRIARIKHIVPQSDFLRLKAAADYLDISPNSLRLLIARKEIPFVNAGKKLFLFRKPDLDQWFEEKKQ